MSSITPSSGQEDRDNLALEFFAKVLPKTGPYYASRKKGTRWKDIFCEDIEALWRTIKQDDLNGFDTYFATARFSTNPGRTINNAEQLCSLRIDIDYGAGHRHPNYQDVRESYEALKLFCAKVELPHPVSIKSGGGLHCYWPFKEDLPRIQWQRYANGLKAACTEHGLRCGHECTTDAARVLRPPFTYNRKLGTPRETELTVPKPGPYEWARAEMLLQYAAKVANLVRLPASSPLPPRPAYLEASSAPAEAFPLRPPADAKAIADQCAQIGHMRATRGVMSEPAWHACIGVLAFCGEEGQALAHEGR